MTPDELRALADALEPLASLQRYGSPGALSLESTIAYLRAQADAQAEPKREPLTARRILEIEDDASRQWRDNGRIIEYAVVFARAVERAHGIGDSDE